MHIKLTAIIFSTFLSAVLVGACSVKSTDVGTKPGEQTGGLFGLSTKDDIEITNQNAFKGKKEVIIGSFIVGFTESKADSAKAGSGFGGKSTAKLKLNNVTPAIRQQITETAYSDFVAQLKTAGYTVLDRSKLTGSSEFKGINSDASPYKKESSFFGSKTEITYVAPKAIGRLFWTGESGFTGGFGMGNPSVVMSGFAEKHQIPVLFVSYVVDFANSAGSGGRFSSVSSVEVGQGLSVSPGSAVKLFEGQGSSFNQKNGDLKLGQAVYSTETYGQVVNTSSDVGVVAETGLNVISAFMGAGTNQFRSFEINADGLKYTKVSNKVLKDTNGKLISKMKSLR